MKTTLTYREALGIATGDVVTTSYGTGPYSVRAITTPKTWHKNWHALTIWPWPVVSLTLTYHDNPHGNAGYINNIHREDNGRWFNSNHDEIFVEKPQTTTPTQISIDSYPPTPDPYPFQPSIDYNAGDGKVWHCPACETDFNTGQRMRLTNRPNCPHCKTRQLPIPIIVIGNGQPGNEYVRGINA